MIPFTFFGSSEFSIHILDELERAGHTPSLIVTTPDRQVGRGLIMTPNIVKTWADSNGRKIPVITELDKAVGDLFIVASFGRIIPQSVLDIPKFKTLNVHPSLLPEYRGASPLQTAMLDDRKQTGVTIMRIDAVMDHGPIVAQCNVNLLDHFPEWPTYEEFEKMMAYEGGKLLALTMAPWIRGELPEVEQDHSKATYTKKILKEDGQIDISVLNADTSAQYSTFRKIQAYHSSPTAFFFVEKKDSSGSTSPKIRVKITSASFKDGHLQIERVIPEGKKEMDYSDFR